MNSKTYSLISGSVFGVVCILYLSTFVGNYDIVIGSHTLPQSFRIIAAALAGFMSFSGLRLFSQS
mgnify:FL=1|jgi:hypothetical protein